MTNHALEHHLSPARLAILVASRFVLNTVFRIAYPLIPFVAARFMVREEVATSIVTAAVVFGLVSPFAGWLGERVGYRRTMLLGLSLAAAGMFCAMLAPAFWALVFAYALCGAGVAVYQPAMQAYVSVLTPYHARGRAVGLVELSWALAGICAVPPLVRLVAAQGTMSIAFAILGVCLCIVTAATAWLPSEPRHMSSAGTAPNMLGVITGQGVWSLLAFVFFAMAGTEIFYIAQPVWATARFEASLADLATAAFVFGIGELVGSSASAFITDRLGKLRAAAFGFAMTAIVFCVLPLLSNTWASYLVFYLLLAVCVEFAIVATLTLASTVGLVGRATIMALTITTLQISRAAGSQLGVPILKSSSLVVTGAIAALLTLFGVMIALRFVQETERHVVNDAL